MQAGAVLHLYKDPLEGPDRRDNNDLDLEPGILGLDLGVCTFALVDLAQLQNQKVKQVGQGLLALLEDGEHGSGKLTSWLVLILLLFLKHRVLLEVTWLV